MCSVYKVLYINKMHQNNPLNSMTIIIGLHKLHYFNMIGKMNKHLFSDLYIAIPLIVIGGIKR